jgi:hypothetical protein
VLGLPGLSRALLDGEQIDLQKVDDALAVIAGQSVYDRRKFVRACGVAMLNDGKAEEAEIEIVRAVGDSLGISFAKVQRCEHGKPRATFHFCTFARGR